MYRAILTSCVLAAAALVLTGCATRMNKHNFDIIRVGVEKREDVARILGAPDAELQNVWLYDDHNHRVAAQIIFDEDDFVISKEWMTADAGEWSEDSPYVAEPDDKDNPQADDDPWQTDDP